MATFKKRIEYIASTEESPTRFTIEDFNLDMTLGSGNTIVVETENKYSEVFNSAKYEYIANFSGLFYSMTSGSGYFGLGGSTVFDNYVSIDPTKYQKVRLEFTATTQSELYIDDVLVAHRLAGLSYGTVSKFYFMWGRGDNQFNFAHKKKYIKIWYNGVLVYDYIPVLDNNDVPCWFDRVSKELLYADTGYTPTVYGDEVPMYASEVEYIGSNNNARFTISNIGLTTSKNLLIETDIKWLNYPNSINGEYRLDLVGGWQGANSAGKWILASGVAGGNVSTTEFQNEKFLIDNINQKTTIFVNNEESVSRTTNPLTIDYVNVFYGTYGATTYYANNLKKYIKVFVDNVLTKDFIPVIDIDGVPAFYDKISNTMLYADAGYVPTIVGGVVTETPSTYQRQKQLLIADKGILPYYCELEYITSEESHLCRFIVENLPYTGESGEVFEYETKFRYHTRATTSEEGDSNLGGYYWQTGGGSNYVRLGGSNPDLYELSTTNFQTLRLKRIAGSKAELYINGNYVGERTNSIGNVPPTNNSFYLFGGKTANQYYMLQDKCYAKFWKDGVLVRDYIPVLDYNGVACLYDRVSGTFLYAESDALKPTVWGREIHPIERIHKERLLNYDLGNPLEVTDTIKMKFVRDDPSVTSILFRQAETEDNVITKLTTTSVSNKYFASAWFYEGAAGSGNTFANMSYDEPTVLEIKSGSITVNGVTDVLSNTGTSAPSGNLFLFGLNSNSSKFYGYFYNFQIISAGGTLKMNVIPIVDETGASNLWDTVARKILPPSGSGSLSYEPIRLACTANTLYTGTNIGGAYTTIPYKANQNTCIRAIIKIDDMQISRYIMGANGYFVSHGIAGSSDRIRFNYNYSSVDLFNLPSYTNILNIVKIKEKNYVNGIEIDNNEGEFTLSDNFNIFTSGGANNSLVGGFILLEISEQGTILFNLIPAIKDGQVGLLDTLTNTLHPSERSGVPFFPYFLPQRKSFNALENKEYLEIEIDTTLEGSGNKSYDFDATGNVNYYVDWGDNNITANTDEHTYATAGAYTVRIYKNDTTFPAVFFGDQNTSHYTCLKKVNTASPAFSTSITAYSHVFRGCINLTYLVDNYFDNNTHITDISRSFRQCSSLTSISKGWLKNLTKINNIVHLFSECPNIQEIPAGLFDNNKAITSASNLFTGAKAITSIPAGLFDKNTVLGTIGASFSGCSNLVDVPADLFKYNVALTGVNYLFNNCSKLETVPDYLFRYNPNLTNFDYCFFGCSRLVIKPTIFCDESTETTTRFASVTPSFVNCFKVAGYLGASLGTAPELWNYTYDGSPTTTDCFTGQSASSLTNYASIPTAWGGAAE